MKREERHTNRPASDVAFTPAVKKIQERLGSRRSYAQSEQGRGWSRTITAELAGFIYERDSFYLGTSSADGQPYIQHRTPRFIHAEIESAMGKLERRNEALQQRVNELEAVTRSRTEGTLMNTTHRPRV